MPPVTRTAHVIMNQGSGAGDKSALHREIETAFKAHDWQVEFIPVGRHDLQSRAKRAAAQALGTIVVAGGDGTINTVASACLEVDRPFGILPAGTFNYVARNLGLPTGMSEAVSVVVDGVVRRVDIGEINGRIFLNNAGFGLYSHMVERREIDKRRFGRNRLVAVFSGIRSLLRSHPLYDVNLAVNGMPERLRTTTLFFGCNALQLESFNVAAADCLRHGKLAVLSLKLHSRWDIIVATCAALAGRLDKAANTDAFCASTVHVYTRRRALKVALDGEIAILRPPLKVTLRTGALQVLAPAGVDD
jgi:diacylglycerol kinase family enzyme